MRSVGRRVVGGRRGSPRLGEAVRRGAGGLLVARCASVNAWVRRYARQMSGPLVTVGSGRRAGSVRGGIRVLPKLFSKVSVRKVL